MHVLTDECIRELTGEHPARGRGLWEVGVRHGREGNRLRDWST